MKTRFLIPGLLVLLLLLPAASAVEPDPQLQRALQSFLRGAEVLRIDAVPDLYEGGYARISVYGRRVQVGGLRVDETMIRLTGVSLDPEALRAGTLKVLDFRDSAMQVRVLLKSLQDLFNAGSASGDILLSADNGYLLGTGTVMFNGRPTAMRMKGFFAVSGTTEIYFYFDTLHANGLPLPLVVIRDLERQMNPILHQRQWPITFKIKSVRLDSRGLTVSTQSDGSCAACGGGEQPAYAP